LLAGCLLAGCLLVSLEVVVVLETGRLLPWSLLVGVVLAAKAMTLDVVVLWL
jgi:hypothetical protein